MFNGSDKLKYDYEKKRVSGDKDLDVEVDIEENRATGGTFGD